MEKAVEKTRVPKEEFEVSQWVMDKNGEPHPVEWKGPKNAKVNIDFGYPFFLMMCHMAEREVNENGT